MDGNMKWHTIYLHIIVKWTGTATPTSFGWYAHATSEARTMARFCETFETFEQHSASNSCDAEEIIRQTVVAYGGDKRTVDVKTVSESRFEELLGLRNEILNQLEELA